MIIYYEIIALLVSIVIPTLKEGEETLYKTLSYLTVQTIFKKKFYENNAEIIISDFDPDESNISYGSYTKFIKDFPSFKNITKFVICDRKGIAYSRHNGIIHSSGKYIVNFDADARFSTTDGIETSINTMISDPSYVLTCCDNIMDNTEIDTTMESNDTILLVKMAYIFTNGIQRRLPIVTLEPGMCVTRYSYDFVGGFNDVKQSEAALLSTRIIYNFGLESKKHIGSTSVIVSPRRAIASANYGILDTWFNYDNAFRSNKSGFVDTVV